MKTKTAMHFTHPYLLNPTNPIKTYLIGAGGTGSNMIMELSKLNHYLIALGHAGLTVTLWDHDTVSEFNTTRQLFAQSEIGLNKAVARINNVNRFWGTDWKAMPYQFANDESFQEDEYYANIYITCVDKIQARFNVAEILKKLAAQNRSRRDKPLYWLDCGNAKSTGQVVLSTVGELPQPNSKLYKTVGNLPFITDEYKELLESQSDDDEPSCSHEEALEKQAWGINSEVAKKGALLLKDLFSNGMTPYKAIFTNLDTYITQPQKVA